MNRTIARVLPTALLGAALIVSMAAYSMGPRHHFDSERMLAHMSEKLHLSEQQEQQIGEVLSSDRGQAEADRDRLQEIRQALEAQRGNFDAEQARRLADELGEISARRAYQMASQHAEIYKLLNPEQREQMDAMKKERGERWRKNRQPE